MCRHSRMSVRSASATKNPVVTNQRGKPNRHNRRRRTGTGPKSRNSAVDKLLSARSFSHPDYNGRPRNCTGSCSSAKAPGLAGYTAGGDLRPAPKDLVRPILPTLGRPRTGSKSPGANHISLRDFLQPLDESKVKSDAAMAGFPDSDHDHPRGPVNSEYLR